MKERPQSLLTTKCQASEKKSVIVEAIKAFLITKEISFMLFHECMNILDTIDCKNFVDTDYADHTMYIKCCYPNNIFRKKDNYNCLD